MSAIDQAFIRAYQPDEEPAAPGRTSAVAPGVRSPVLASGGGASEKSGIEQRPHFSLESFDGSFGASMPRSFPPTAVPLSLGLAGNPRTASASDSTASISSPPAQRRPLSSFAPPTPTVEARFQPAFEVDAFRWSETCNLLVAQCGANLERVVAALVEADEAGCSLIGVGALAAGAGATTVAATLARQLVAAGKTVALVDGDFRTAELAGQLGLAVELGWEDVLAGRVPLAEAVVRSVEDRLVLLPLVAGGIPAAEKVDGIHASVSAGVLRYHYDIVLFDLGAVLDPVQGPIARRLVKQCRLDGALLVTGEDRQTVDRQAIERTIPEIAALTLGVVHNQLAAA